MNPVSKEEFKAILDRQQQSGLSIRDFCSNEAYTVSSFHYWKSKHISNWYFQLEICCHGANILIISV
jgi:putative transposase